MLDELMGRNRNIHPNEKVKEITWEDPQVCRYYIVQFCPHDLFTNTKADLGSCPKIHDEDLRKNIRNLPIVTRKLSSKMNFYDSVKEWSTTSVIRSSGPRSGSCSLRWKTRPPTGSVLRCRKRSRRK